MARPDLRSVPVKRERAIALVRVSRLGGRGEEILSPDNQRHAIREHAQHHGLDIVDEVEGLDESGSRLSSRWWDRLDAAVARIVAGEASVLVAWKWSRVARHRLRWATVLDTVEAVGGRVESATEGVDVTTSTGRFTRGILAEVNMFQAEQIGETWKETHANRLARGLPATGRARFGYERTPDGGYQPHPTEGPLLAEAYERYLAGESLRALTAWIGTTSASARGKRRDGRPAAWSERTLTDILDAGFGAGLLSVHDPNCAACRPKPRPKCRNYVHLPGAQKPVVDEATWRAYQAARRERSHPQLARSSSSPYLLSGLARCWDETPHGPCEGAMAGSTTSVRGGPRVGILRCTRATKERAHPGGAVRMSHVEAEVMKWLTDLAADVEAATARAQAQEDILSRELDAARAEVEAAHGAVVEATRRALTLPADDAVTEVLDELRATEARALRRVVRLEARQGARVPARVAAEALADWPILQLEHKRAVLRSLVARVEVTSGLHAVGSGRRMAALVNVVPA